MNTVPRLAIVLLLAVALLLAAGSRSDTRAPVAKTPSRYAVVNLMEVIKGYTKAKKFQSELKEAIEPYQTKDNALKADGEQLSKEAQNPGTTAARREEVETKLKEIQRAIEDNKVKAQRVVVKKQEDQLVVLYKDVQGVVKQLAKDRDLDLVMHFNDAIAEADLFSPGNIARKMQAGALMPMHVADGLDLTKDVLTVLNKAAEAKEES